MLYAIFEIIFFLLLAALFGFIIGWMLHARGGSKWQLAYDQERIATSRLRNELEECKKSALAAAAAEPVKPKAKSPAKKENSLKKENVVEKTSQVDGDVELPDKDSAVSKMAGIAMKTAGGKVINDDNLKKVKGIGPKLEGLLKDLGITSYRQIANFKSDDIQYVTAALESFPGRIERDNWMASAADLHKEVYGEKP